MTAIHWFRQDLRLSDNPALVAAAKQGEVLPVYILDDNNAGEAQMGGASRVWLHHALESLNISLNGHLRVFQGDAKTIIQQLVKQSNAKAVYWNRCYEPWRITRDTDIKKQLSEQDIDAHTFNGSMLREPWDTLKDNSEPYKVFTPYYKKNYVGTPIREPIKAPEKMAFSEAQTDRETISSLNLLPTVRWDKKITSQWDISEKGAKNRLHDFLDNGIQNYKEGRNFPATNHNSRLSPYMHFGQISPNQIWHSALFYETNKDIENFCVELAWREFSLNLLYHFPDLPHKNLQAKFDVFPWKKDHEALKKWQQGMTGYPIVDAGMRELWQTGFMHNRVRMVVASFLVKNLLIHWHEGEKWFWDCLVDADLASNSASWQWVAGCGADAAPYFRVFNPITQGERFDGEGIYTRKYVPEIANLPDKYLFKPWEAPQEILDAAGITLGVTYPMPIVDVKASRQAALDAYERIKGN